MLDELMDSRGAPAGSRPRFRLLAVLALKLMFSILLTVVLLETATRLVAPEERFELIPNTFDPVCGIRHVSNARGFVRCPEYCMEFRTNSGGLRADGDIPYENHLGRRRILCLGDSFTCGMGVHGHETFSALLDSAGGAETEVLNAGVCAWGTAEQLAWYELEGRRYHPDVVVLAHVVNDWCDNTKGGLFTLASDGSLVQHAAVEGRTLRWMRCLRRLPGYGSWFAGSHALNRFRQWFAVRHHGRLEQAAAGDADPVALWEHERDLGEALLLKLREVCERDGAKLLIMPVPAQPGAAAAERHQEELFSFLSLRDFDLLDLRPEYADRQAAGQQLYYPVDGHWTAAGHRLAAGRLGDLMRNEVFRTGSLDAPDDARHLQ